MNISAGGPHIVFFERDQQLTALLMSEFQLAGYECHAARTAVEVFDTIARFPVRMLLVNLAQAAAGRREFWVALDTQRRGRGVQVLTYLCTNLAGYGPRDIDDRPQSQSVDIEIDGMLGLMNLVDAVRERIPGSNSVSTINTQPRVPRMTQAPPATPSFTTVPPTPARQPDVSASAVSTGPLADTHSYQVPRASTQGTSLSAPLNPQTYSEKIRAVLYPTPSQRIVNVQEPPTIRTSLQMQEAAGTTRTAIPPREAEYPTVNYDEAPRHVQQNMQSVEDNAATQHPASNVNTLQQLAYGSRGVEQESGLDQLSRLLQERRTTRETNEDATAVNTAYRNFGNRTHDTYNTAHVASPEQTSNVMQTPQSSRITESLDTQSLRASPIEDLPRDRATSGSSGTDATRRVDSVTRTHGQYGYAPQSQHSQPAVPLASIATLRTPMPPTVAKATMPIPSVQPIQNTPQPIEEPAPTEYFSATAQPSVQERRPVQEARPAKQATQEPQPVQPTMQEVSPTHSKGDESFTLVDTSSQASGQKREDDEVRDEVETKQDDQQQVQQEYASMQNILQGRSGMGIAPNNAMLLDIVQSLPMMPSPPPQQQAVSGRTMRTLGSVLLEGHLVPENRLEVAQNIQRMLRGVDLNYQLGEILLMFKLLTPDQLLAASLVSYGMISTQQISALGRIRQELHSIGLEYDLESLLILFRMLTPEQLREIRASWLS